MASNLIEDKAKIIHSAGVVLGEAMGRKRQ
jgi:hypothetical protein